VCSSPLQTNAGKEPDGEDEMVCCEALEIMTLCFALLPTALDTLSKEKAWQTYIIDLLLHCHSKYVCIWLLIYVCCGSVHSGHFLDTD
jgi:hypothetical protein